MRDRTSGKQAWQNYIPTGADRSTRLSQEARGIFREKGVPMSTVIVEKHGGVATIRMNRPDRMNAYA